MIRNSYLLLVTFFFTFSTPQSLYPQQEQTPPFISFTLVVEKEFQADTAILVLDLTTKNRDMSIVVREYQESEKALMEILAKNKVPQEAIRKQSLSTRPSHNMMGNDYVIESKIRVTLENLSNLDSILGDLDPLRKSLTVLRIEYAYSDREQIYKTLTLDAAEKTNKRAALYQQLYNVKLKLHSIEERTNINPEVDQIEMNYKYKSNTSMFEDEQGGATPYEISLPYRKFFIENYIILRIE